MQRIDINSPEWFAIKAHIEARLKVHNKQLKSRGLPMAETENARGAILELELLLDLPNQQGVKIEFKVLNPNAAEYGVNL